MPKNKKWLPYVLLAAILIITLWLNKGRKSTSSESANNKKNTEQTSAKGTNRADAGLNRNPTNIKLTKHAKCRMECRHIDLSEIKDMIANGVIDYNKSQTNNKPDPKYALEGKTKDGQEVRIVLAQNGQQAIIITVIDLDTKWSCHCPGD